jgi:hypothetical protein
MNIYEKMAAITADLQTVAKNLTVTTSKTASYKAVSERDILDAVKPLEAKHGVYSYPMSREILESHMLESENEFQGKVQKKTTFMTRIQTIYRFVNTEKPDEFIDTITFAEGIDPQDKGSGKAMTYADKYALMKAYKISTGDDPDQDESREQRYTPAPAAKPAQKPAPKLTYRQRVLNFLTEKNLDKVAFAEANNVDKNTTEEEFAKLLGELEADYASV